MGMPMMEQTITEMLNVQHEQKLSYLNRRVSPKESYESLLTFPRYFEIETVNACNARCPMCTIADWDRKAGLMSDATFDRILKEIAQHPEVKRIHLYRDGEPLLDKKLANRVFLLKRAGVKRVGISTNAALLDFINARDLLLADLDEIILSIDSLKPSVYESIRVGLDFEQVMRNATDFIALRKKIRPQTQIWVRMIRQESNKDEWPAYHQYWSTLLEPHDRIDYRNIHNWGDQLKDFKPISRVTNDMPCVALWSLMVIFANGDVPMCNVDYNNKYPLGNVMKSSIEELWKSKVQNDRRAIHLTDRSQLPPCKNCTVWDEAI